jgi:hypothetical protein
MDHNIIKLGVWSMELRPQYGVTVILKFCEHRTVQWPLSVLVQIGDMFSLQNLVDNLIYLHQVYNHQN